MHEFKVQIKLKKLLERNTVRGNKCRIWESGFHQSSHTTKQTGRVLDGTLSVKCQAIMVLTVAYKLWAVVSLSAGIVSCVP